MNQFFIQSAHNLVQNMANLETFKPPELYKKLLEVKCLFNFELSRQISSMEYKKFLSKIIISKID